MELVASATVVVAVLLALLVAGAIAAVALMRRRARGVGSRTDRAAAQLETTAGARIVTLDDAVAAADVELGFARAQFGETRTASFAAAVEQARATLAEAFELRRRLEDDVPDARMQRDLWAQRIIEGADAASVALEERAAEFRTLRTAETRTGDRLAALRRDVAAVWDEVPVQRDALDALAARFDTGDVTTAREALDAAGAVLGEIETSLADLDDTADAPVTAESERLDALEADLARARELVGAVERSASLLAGAEAHLASLQATAQIDVAEARAARADAPDADHAAEIDRAVADLIDALAHTPPPGVAPVGPFDPHAAAAGIRSGLDRLDLAMAAARTQAQRLAHAREALEGALFIATSQITAARDAITTQGRGTSGARARLDEAEQELAEARAASDPVEALDTARRAATHARDAEALARWK